jgi:hypothetical protein
VGFFACLLLKARFQRSQTGGISCADPVVLRGAYPKPFSHGVPVGFFYLSAFESWAFNAAKQDGLAALIQLSYEGRTQSLSVTACLWAFFICLLLKAGLSTRPNKKSPSRFTGKALCPGLDSNQHILANAAT